MKEIERAKTLAKSGFDLPFDGELKCIDNRLYVWTDIEGERVCISATVNENDTAESVSDRLIADWEEKKETIERENNAWESPFMTQGYRGDSLTL